MLKADQPNNKRRDKRSKMTMTANIVEKTFEALFDLEDLREIWRKTAPFHNLTKKQKEEAEAILNRVRKALDEIEREIR
jgi:cytochrome c556